MAAQPVHGRTAILVAILGYDVQVVVCSDEHVETAFDNRVSCRTRSPGATSWIEFELTEIARGTRLTVRHSGDFDARTIDAFNSGSPVKLRMLLPVLGAPD